MRRFNYTGRRRIPESDVQIALAPQQDGSLGFKLALNLKNVLPPLPPTTHLIVEAYDGPLFERFEMGPAQEQMEVAAALKTFGPSHSPLFRVKLVEPSDPKGRIAAHAQAIRAQTPGEDAHARSLLHVTARRLDDLVFKLEFPEDGYTYPTLVINESLADPNDLGAKALAKHPIFASVVMPQAFKEVLTHLIFIDQTDADSSEDSWQEKWLLFGERLAGSSAPDSQDFAAARDWIDRATEAFARRIQAIERFKQVIAS